MSQYFGRASVKANGIKLDSKPGASIDLGGTKRNSVVNDHTMGYTEEPKPARIECELALKRGDTVEGYRNITDGTAVFECDTGQRYIVKGVYTEETLTINKDSIKLVLVGEPAEELVS